VAGQNAWIPQPAGKLSLFTGSFRSANPIQTPAAQMDLPAQYQSDHRPHKGGQNAQVMKSNTILPDEIHYDTIQCEAIVHCSPPTAFYVWQHKFAIEGKVAIAFSS
jgi:hypothetical protein